MNPFASAKPLLDIALQPEIIPPDAGAVIAIAAAAAAVIAAAIFIVRAYEEESCLAVQRQRNPFGSVK